jgi:hypothetical protein
MSPWWAAWGREERDSAPARTAYLGKLRGFLVRLAQLLAAIDTVCDGLEKQLSILSFFNSDARGRRGQPVTDGHAERALMLSTFFLAQYDGLQDVLGHGDVPPKAAKLLAHAQMNGNKPVKTRELHTW